MSTLSREDEFLLQEYRAAEKLTYHIDELRSKLTGFFLTFGGIAAAGLAAYAEGKLAPGEASRGRAGDPVAALAVLVLLAAAVAVLVVFIIGRLRRAQIEHFRIVNNIREYFLGTDARLWNVVELSSSTLPSPTRTSGSYGWVLMVMLLGAYFFAFAIHLMIGGQWGSVDSSCAPFLDGAAFVLMLVVLDIVYFQSASPPAQRSYKEAPVEDERPLEVEARGGNGEPAGGTGG